MKKGVQKKRGKRGMPPFVPTDEQRHQVESLVGMGLTHEQIAHVIINPRTGKPIDQKVLRRRFPQELERGGSVMYARVVSSLYQKATSKDHPQAAVCAMFVLKCKHGWRQADKVIHETEGGTSGVLLVPAPPNAEDWVAAQRAKNEKKKAPGGGNG